MRKLLVILVFLIGCDNTMPEPEPTPAPSAGPISGEWRMTFDMGDCGPERELRLTLRKLDDEMLLVRWASDLHEAGAVVDGSRVRVHLSAYNERFDFELTNTGNLLGDVNGLPMYEGQASMDYTLYDTWGVACGMQVATDNVVLYAVGE